MKLTVKSIRERKNSGEKITVLTAYDFLFARILDRQGIDIVLVGDSLGMVTLGYESTVPVTMRDMVHHTRAVARGVSRALIVADLPFGSFEMPEKALRNAFRLMKQSGADAVKLEGGKNAAASVKALVEAGIPVMGHLGMTPQTAGNLGGFRVQGRTPPEAKQILEDAALLDSLGVFAIVLECIPEVLGEEITRAVSCPTIGIGAGPGTDGQVLVLWDMLGMKSAVTPKFVRHFAGLQENVENAVAAFRREVASGGYPSREESY